MPQLRPPRTITVLAKRYNCLQIQQQTQRFHHRQFSTNPASRWYEGCLDSPVREVDHLGVGRGLAALPLEDLAVLGVVDEEVGGAGEAEEEVADVSHPRDPYRPVHTLGLVVLEKKCTG